MLPSRAFKEYYKVVRFCQLSVKVIINETVKSNKYWIFLIFFVFTFFSGASDKINVNSSEFICKYRLQQDTD